jgi:hypothetical protein
MQQAVIVHLRLSDDHFGSREERDLLFELGDRLNKVIDDAGVGEFDGDEFGQGECVLFMYGPDADRLYSVIEPVLKATPLAAGRYAIKRYGETSDLNALEVNVTW